MDRFSHHAPQQHRVTAVFGDHKESFHIASGSTLGQLAERLADLAQQNHSWPVGIAVVFETAPRVPNETRSRSTHGGASRAPLVAL